MQRILFTNDASWWICSSDVDTHKGHSSFDVIVCERTQESNVEKLSIVPGNGCFEEPGEMSESVTCLV